MMNQVVYCYTRPAKLRYTIFTSSVCLPVCHIFTEQKSIDVFVTYAYAKAATDYYIMRTGYLLST